MVMLTSESTTVFGESPFSLSVLDSEGLGLLGLGCEVPPSATDKSHNCFAEEKEAENPSRVGLGEINNDLLLLLLLVSLPFLSAASGGWLCSMSPSLRAEGWTSELQVE